MIALTGATGFVGADVLRQARLRQLEMRALLRVPTQLADATEVRIVGDLCDPLPPSMLAGCHAVIHCAARAHVLKEVNGNPDSAFLRANCEATIAVAESAATAGVKRFVFVSSIKVLGERTLADAAFHPDDSPNPSGPYGRSKAAAERELKALATRTGMELVIVRPPLVHGAGAKGHLELLLGAIRRGLPLPLNGIDNRRSLIHVENLSNLLLDVVSHPRAAGQTLHVADREVLSIPDMVRAVAEGMAIRPRLFTLSPSWLRTLARLTHREAMMGRLTESLVVDASRTVSLLGWQPRVTAQEGLRRMGAAAR